VITLRGRGVPAVGDRGRGRGNLHVVIEVAVPSVNDLSPRGRELVLELQKELGGS
jgi:DnaJ-class molecular chaperone